MKILGFVGSLRKGSYNRALMRAVEAQLPRGSTLEILEIGSLPLFNQDDEKSAYPMLAQKMKDAIRECDGVIIATPEYNRSIPGSLKNMLDWTSRPYGDNAWPGKPVLVVGVSSGNIGTALAQYDLKKILVYLNARVLGQPEFYLNATGKFDDAGNLTDPATKEHIQKILAVFADFIK